MVNPESHGRLSSRLVTGVQSAARAVRKAAKRVFPTLNSAPEAISSLQSAGARIIPFLRQREERIAPDPQMVLQAIEETKRLIADWKNRAAQTPACTADVSPDAHYLTEYGVLEVLRDARWLSSDCANALSNGHAALRNARYHLENRYKAVARKLVTNEANIALTCLEQAEAQFEIARLALSDVLKQRLA